MLQLVTDDLTTQSRRNLADHAERDRRVRQRVEKFSAIVTRAEEAERQVQDVRRELADLDAAEQGDLDKWVREGGVGSPPPPRSDARQKIQARLGTLVNLAAAHRRAAENTKPDLELAEGELETLERQQPRLIAAVLVDEARVITREYCDLLRASVRRETVLGALRDAARQLDTSAQGIIIAMMRRGDRDRAWEEPLVPASSLQSIRKDTMAFAERLKADPLASLDVLEVNGSSTP